MNDNRKIILNKIDQLINKRQSELLNESPIIHEIDRGIIIHSFNKWYDDDNFRSRKISNLNSSNSNIIYLYIPKGSYFEQKNHNTITIICLNGIIELNVRNKYNNLNTYNKIDVNCEPFHGKAIENSYLQITCQ